MVENRQTTPWNCCLERPIWLAELAGTAFSRKSRSILAGMDDVFVARTRLEGGHGQDPNRLFSVVEQTRGRSLVELLVSAPLGDLKKPPELRAGERQIAALQLQLYRSKGRADRQRLLDQIFSAEERLAPVETELFNSTRINPRKAVTLKDLQ